MSNLHPSDRPRMRRPSAFTLIELLVVVGLISLLIALLLPGLRKAREHANRVKCAGNLRSIGQAMAMYTQHYRYYPGCAYVGNETGKVPLPYRALWPVRLRPFLGGGRHVWDVMYCPSQDETFRWDGTEGASGLVYHADDLDVSYGYEPGERVLHAHFSRFSYGYNYVGGGSNQFPEGLGGIVNEPRFSTKELHASRVRRPAEVICVTDTGSMRHFEFATSGHIVYGWNHSLVGTIHGGGANILFCDGHVQWHHDLEVSYDQVLRNERYERIRRMWSYDNSTGWPDG